MKRYQRTREQCGLSLGQAAALVGVDRDWLDAAEHGWTPADEHLSAMAKVYGCSVAWLRGDTAELSAENQALLNDIDHTSDRSVVREFMEMLSTRDPGEQPQPSASDRLSAVRAWDAPPNDTAAQEAADHRADVPVARKRRYVKQQSQTRDHGCHWPGCTEQVPPAMWGCKKHWFKLPKALRDRIWRTYAPGQEVDMTPSDEYLKVADDVQRWIEEQRKP